MSTKKKYYEYYEDVYAPNVGKGIDRFNNPIEPPDPARIHEMNFIHGDNIIYARK